MKAMYGAVAGLRRQERLPEGQVDQHAAERRRSRRRARSARRSGGVARVSAAADVGAGADLELGLGLEDRRDHLVGRAVADPAEDEQQRRSRSRNSGSDFSCEAISTTIAPSGHGDEVAERDHRAAEAVGQRAADRPDQRAEQRAEEGQRRRP